MNSKNMFFRIIFVLFITIFVFSCNEEFTDEDMNNNNTESENVSDAVVQARNNTVAITKENENKNSLKEDDKFDYDNAWAEVKKSRNLPKSRLKIVDTIYENAKKYNNDAQYIKAILYKMNYLQRVEEDTLVKIHKMLLNEIESASSPRKQILSSMLAEQYWNYYNQNRYKFLNRTKVSDVKKYDMKTWTLDKIIKETEKYYKLSLENSENLKKVKIDDYSILLSERKDTRKFHPTVYDFLIYRAIKFYSNNESSLTKPAYYFTLNNKNYFLPTKEFIKLKIESKDVENFAYIAIKLYQEWAKSHFNDKNKEVLIDLELKRLEFVYKKGVFLNKKLIYENLLKKLAEKYKKEDIVAEVYHKIALLYIDLSSNYNPNISDKYKDYKKKAHKICSDVIKNYPKSFGAINCERLVKSVESKFLKLITENSNPTNKKFKALLEYKNINKVYIKIVKTTFEEYRKQINTYGGIVKFYNNKKASLDFSIDLPDDKDFNKYKTEIPFDKLKSGKYIIIISEDGKFDFDKSVIAYSLINITNISYVIKNGKGGVEFYLKDSETGETLKNVRLDLYEDKWSRIFSRYYLEKKKKLKVNSKGYVKLPKGNLKYNNFYINFRNNDDSYMPQKSFYIDYYYNPQQSQKTTYYFTDRKIYRPGQTLYFKALVVNKHNFEGEKTKILPNINKTITLYDANSQKVSSLNLKTNEFGTINGNFVIPSDRLNGQYYLSDGYNISYFSVEEYKRPKFEVKFKKAEKEYKLGQKIIVKGFAKAYAGFNIDNAIVKYRVVRTTFYPYSWYWYGYYPPTPSIEIKNGFTKTDAKGEFAVKFEAIPDLSVDKSKKPAFRYTVYADITDLNGETRSSSKTISLGYTSLQLSVSIDGSHIDKILNDYTVNVNSSNLSGEFVPAKGELKIYKLTTPNKLYRNKKWAKADKYLIKKENYNKDYPFDEYKDENNYYKWKKENLVFTTPFDTSESKKISLKNINKWKVGKYLFIASSKDKFGNEILDKKYFDVIDSNSKEMPFKKLAWFKKLSKTTNVGENAEFLIGSSDKNVHVLYEVEHRGKIVTKEFVLNNEQKKISIPVMEKHRGNFFVNFLFIKHNRVFSFNNNVYVPWDNKELKISFETFRDKLAPAQKEEWKIKITGAKKDKVMAEMVATLYDASLDTFRANSWYLSLFPSLYMGSQWRGAFNTSSSRYIGYYYRGYSSMRKYYDELNWFGFYWRNHYRYRTSRGVKFKKREARISKSLASAEMDDDESTKKEVPMPTIALAEKKAEVISSLSMNKDRREDKKAESNKNTEGKDGGLNSIKARTNFNETAFFYPNLKTDKNGNIIISFTAPESLTKWKMLGFAHTKKLEYGIIQNELITQKDLMIIPNAPRFLREGDKIIFTAKITNLTDKILKGKAKLMLLDAITMKPIDDLFKNNKNEIDFTAKKGNSPLLSWELSIPDSVDAVTYRVVAQSGNFTDGEEMALPILKNRMLVTETMPLPIRASQTKTFKFKKLIESKNSKTLKNHKLTLEFTSNPVWYAVQALPYLMEYPYECNEQTFSRYYANSLASYIVNSNPKIKRVFDRWKSINSKELKSNLEKNQELKSIILKETPWVRDAYSETEQKRRIGLLFDLNKMSGELKRALSKLTNAQLPSGGWPWFKGGYESRWITQYIVTGFAHLYRLKVINVQKNTVIWNMLKKAVSYLDRQIKRDYDHLVTYKKDLSLNHLGYLQIHYLYSRSYFKDMITLPTASKKAFDYYFGQSQKFWNTYNKYSQAMIALYLNRYKDSKLANKIMDSIKEHFIESEEMGLYFKESYGYYWYNAPIETHALMVEAFDEIKNDAKTIDGLKTWLLKSKQTQNWKTTKATVNAIYALLLRGSDWLKESKQADITIGNYKIITTKMPESPYFTDEKGKKMILKHVKAEAGTGYIKTSWIGDAITPEMGEITVKNNNKLVAWGGVYWQYFEDLDKITFAKTPLVLKKQLFVERSSDKGPILKALTKDEKISVGDRIKVRIILTVDRDMEYVHMKDMRASNLEPENVISMYKWQDGLGYYESTKDASTDFFFDYLRKGTYVFEYPLRITHKGDFSNGITTIQSMYAPEFTSHSEGVRIEVK